MASRIAGCLYLITKVDGDSTPHGQRTFCVLLVVCRILIVSVVHISLTTCFVEGWLMASSFSRTHFRMIAPTRFLLSRRSLANCRTIDWYKEVARQHSSVCLTIDSAPTSSKQRARRRFWEHARGAQRTLIVLEQRKRSLSSPSSSTS